MKKHTVFIRLFTLVILLASPDNIIFGEEPQSDAIQYLNIDNEIELGENPNIDDYVRMGWNRNALVKASFKKWQSSIARISVARGLPAPSISFGYFIENVETKVGPQEYKIGLVQMFPWFGKLKTQGEIQTQNAEAEYYNLIDQMLQLKQKIVHTYFDYYFLVHSQSITSQNLDLVKNWENVLLIKYKTASVGHPNLIKTQIEYIKLQDDLNTLEAKSLPLLKEMAAHLNLNHLDSIIFPEVVEYTTIPWDKDYSLSLAQSNNPGLLVRKSNVSKHEYILKRAKLNKWPDFGFGVDYVGTGVGNNGTDGKDPLMFMVTMKLPLWPGKISSQIKAARLGLEAANNFVIEKENRLNTQLEKEWFQLEDQQRKIDLYNDQLIPKSLESLRSSEKAYISDQLDFINLVDAQRRYLQFRLEYEKALAQYFKSFVNIQVLLGEVSL